MQPMGVSDGFRKDNRTLARYGYLNQQAVTLGALIAERPVGMNGFHLNTLHFRGYRPRLTAVDRLHNRKSLGGVGASVAWAIPIRMGLTYIATSNR